MKKKNTHRGLAFFCTFLIFCFLGVCVMVGFATSDPNDGVSGGGSSEEAVKKLAKSALTGETATLTEEELSALLQNGLDSLPKNRTLRPEGVELHILADGEAEAYLPVDFRGKRLGVTVVMLPESEYAGSLRTKISAVRVGRLPIPPTLVLYALEAQLSEGLRREGDSLVFDNLFLQIPVAEETVTLEAELISVTREGFQVRISTSTEELKEKIKAYAQEKLKDGLNELLSKAKP